MQKVLTGLLILVAIIHLLPLSGVLGIERLAVLYGITFNEPNLEILMRHRAILFGLFGAFILYAAFTTRLQLLAIIAGFVSVFSFMFLAWSVGDYNESIQKVVIADVVALIALVGSGIIYFLRRN